ncbi:MAG: ArsR/SmtB family transcription factor [Bacteroidota bacterium]
MTESEAIGILKALSVNSRIQIIKLIRDRKLCVNAIATRLEITQSAVSQHLKILRECNIVHAERYGSIIHYRLNRIRTEEFLNSLNEMLTNQEK